MKGDKRIWKQEDVHFQKWLISKQTILILDLNDRKALILELQMNLDGELNSNISTHSKLNGTAVLFSTSPFHLVHLASMKFVSLSKDKSESYS